MADALCVKDTVIGRRGAYDTPLTAGLVAGEALEACSPCFIASGDGKVYMANRSAHKETDSGAAFYCGGFTDRAVSINQPLTLFGRGTEMHYAAATLTPGAFLYIADTNGRLTEDEITYTVATDLLGGTQKIRVSPPVAVAKDASTIVIL